MSFKRPFLLLAVLLGCTSQLAAQTPTDDVDVIRVNTDVTNLPFTVLDKQRRFITTLNVDDIRVLEDGVPQQLFTFQRQTDRPLAIAFLIDVSISQQYTLSDEKAAARGFIESAIHSNKDQVAIVPFTGQAFLEQGLTRDVLSVYQVLQQIDVAIPAYQGAGRPLSGIRTGPGLPATPPEGTTAIWDAIALTSSQVLAKTQDQRRRTIVLLTDGLDTASRLRRTDAINDVLAAEAVVYAIGIGDSKGEGVNKSVIKELAERTGGRAFFPKKADDLQAAFAEIEKELRTQYLIAYSSSNKKRDGAYRRITIELSNPQLKNEKLEIRHRPGYFAKKS
ncbi:MAG TPA: VWA domain-containing protein [Pyrinomonadaceae bacterium]|nr:VWA domain-containing protein [Pyrinomonadaceae bacterium]